MPLINDGEDSSRFGAYIKLIGNIGALTSSYLLMAVGALSLLMAAYHAWSLYIDPNTISVFTDAFVRTAFSNEQHNASDIESYRLMSWPVVIFLLLIQAKIGIWAVDAAVHLLDTIQREKKEAED
ncbi:MAG: hypothetical protein OQL16_10285 [Gammaproteobacteria bacterium]|nr:hypothetical protein [Gammaproteobacteria bacterium]